MGLFAELSPPVFWVVVAALFVTWVFVIRRYYYPRRKR
jgi:hypothetical protein